eukprot:491227-Pyramimonas_sp.AAC.1
MAERVCKSDAAMFCGELGHAWSHHMPCNVLPHPFALIDHSPHSPFHLGRESNTLSDDYARPANGRGTTVQRDSQNSKRAKDQTPGGELKLPGGELKLPGDVLKLSRGELKLPGDVLKLSGGEIKLPG